MSALTEADHEEITDTLLAARERIEHLTICGAALQAENDRLRDAMTVAIQWCPQGCHARFVLKSALAKAGKMK